MRSSNRKYLYPVDQLRAAAALLVVLYHSVQLISASHTHHRFFQAATDWPYTRNPLATVVIEGHTGVALFMVLSGFIFTVGTLGADVRWLTFMRNRVLRIYPLYLVLLAVGGAEMSTRFDFGQFARLVLGLGSFGGIDYGGPWGAMFWAVSVEIQFYLLFPLLLRLLNRQGPTVLLKMIAAMVVLRVMAVLVQPDLDLTAFTYTSIVGRLDQFLFGMLAAVVFVKRRTWCRAPTLVVSTLAAVAMLWGFNQLHGYADPQWWRTVWVDVEGAVWAAFIASYVAVFERRKGFLARGVAAVGERSYSIYLLHFVIVSWVAFQWGWIVPVGGPLVGAFLTGLVVVVPAALVVGFISFSAIERPFLTLRGRYVEPASTAPATPVLASEDGLAPLPGRHAHSSLDGQG